MKGLFNIPKNKRQYKWMQGGNVPGGHNVLFAEGHNPFITPMRECNSISLRYSDVVCDIGAYVGTYAIRCARFPVKKVIAYEPTPMTYDILSLISLPNLNIKQMAVVGDDQREVKLFISKGIGVTNSIVLSKSKAYNIVIPAINYIDAVRDATIVKIDIEGGEYNLPIIQSQLRAIIIDFHPVPDFPWQEKARLIMQDIRNAGFIPVLEPTFSNGWDIGGSWIREKETFGECEILMQGRACCGCGKEISNMKSKSLCKECYDIWLPKHRVGFSCVNEVNL